jgi:hypothetical protein
MLIKRKWKYIFHYIIVIILLPTQSLGGFVVFNVDLPIPLVVRSKA